MNETRRIALEFAMRFDVTNAEMAIGQARKIEAYLMCAEQTDAANNPAHDMAIRMFSDTAARP
ncbi:hypothetical protein [Asaia sp. HumB]|uniref:hypothetical protein n=1 Tax=Asaia sp. HumB TaxID=3035475 RepID=UPI002555972E|nr:hypothetical protein [Asaia sp. HumB]MDL2172436.1 hypothetical protein [Asaia sp. HumB]